MAQTITDNQFFRQLTVELGGWILLSSTSQKYMDFITGPYINALHEMKSKEEILEWIPLTFTDRVTTLMTEIVRRSKADLTHTDEVYIAETEVIYTMIILLSRAARELADEIITPWNIATIFDTIIRGKEMNMLF